jgi:hypothetical protein
MLRRAILVAGGLTTGNWCEHRLREEEAGLGARWRHRRNRAIAAVGAREAERGKRQMERETLRST